MLSRKHLLIILILLLAFVLRTYRLTEIPPGLTHDEANHGRDSINVLDGVLLFYFPLNYGSEPLYNYVVAGNMALLGENLFALRLVNVFFGILTIAAMYLWGRWAFDRPIALIAAALMAVSFWPLASSRQALRAGMLPFLALGAVLFFWYMVSRTDLDLPGRRRRAWWAVTGFALCVTATLHTYLAARVLWLVFPIFIVYLAIFHRQNFHRAWFPSLAGLVAAGLLVMPMFAYVRAHPEAETRLQMLDGSLQNLVTGNWNPVVTNLREALLAFVWPGYGDHFLAYNIPGRPVFDALTATIFVFGVIVCLRRWRQPASAFLLIWFLVGISPSLITGPQANTTRNLGALPATYLLASVGFVFVGRWLIGRWGRPSRLVVTGALILWLGSVAMITVRDYFVRWGESPDVRAAYQQNLVQALDRLAGYQADSPVVLSTVYPGPAHDPSIARVLLPSDGLNLRWVDARYALILPNGRPSQLIVPSSTPLHPAFSHLTEYAESVALRPDDLDPSFALYGAHAPEWDSPDASVNFDDAVSLLDARWLTDSVQPGGTAELLTVWRVQDPTRVGPRVPPAFETDAVLFTHVLDATGSILTQRDALDAPSWDWQAGDVIMQVHPLSVPREAKPGLYETAVGVYDRASGERLPVLDAHGEIVDNRTFVVPLRVDER